MRETPVCVSWHSLQWLKVWESNAEFSQRFVHGVDHYKRSLLRGDELKHAGQTVLVGCRGNDYARPTDGFLHRFRPRQFPDSVGGNSGLSDRRAVHDRRIRHGESPVRLSHHINLPKHFLGYPSFQSKQQDPVDLIEIKPETAGNITARRRCHGRSLTTHRLLEIVWPQGAVQRLA